ncbi:MAG: hypothetical protein U1C58_06300 [Flavobacteriaceae bacterium]|nr:hypothetical protein [Flavobacteriaceae bacterium]
MIEEIFKQAVLKSKKTEGKFTLIVGTVTAINNDSCTVDDYEDVRLNAVIDDLTSQVTVYPKVGSKVIIGRLEGEDDAFLVRTSEIDKVTVRMGDQLLELFEGKFTFKSGEISVKSIMNDILERLQSAIIITPSGPGKFSDPDKLFLNETNEKVNQLFAQ